MKILAAWTTVAMLVLGAPTKAEDFSVIVEDAGAGAPVQVFSYLPQGHVIDLGTETEIVLGYLHSCVQEHLRGGVVTIGKERSEIHGGERSSIEFDCGASAELSQSEAERGAVLVMRKSISEPGPTRLMTVSPVIAPKKPASAVKLTRLDRSEPVMTLELHGGVADLAERGRTLSRGGSYLVETGASSVVVRVDSNARSGDEHLLPRLLSF